MSETRVVMRPQFKGIARTGVLLRTTRHGLWLILRDGRKKPEPYHPSMWEIVK